MRAVLVLTLFAGLGCDDVRDLRWQFRFDGVDAPYVEARVLRGGCTGTELFSTSFARGGAAERPPRLGDGLYGFEVFALNDTCTVVGQGCEDVTLPVGEVTVTVREVVAGPSACDIGETCIDGRCIPGAVDAGGECDGCCPGDGCIDGECVPATPVSSVAAAATHSCAIRGDDVYCWGTGANGELGLGAAAGLEDVPAPLDEGGWESVSGRLSTTCVRSSAGEVRCWGANEVGQVGMGSSSPGVFVPTTIAGGRTYTAVGVGWEHVCAIGSDRLLYCWGKNGDGQAGPIVGPSVLSPTMYDGMRWDLVALGDELSCGFSGGALLCWGDDTYGNVGAGRSGASQLTPVAPAGATMWRSVAPGARHTCAIDLSSNVWCWGKNGSDGTGDNRGAIGLGGAGNQTTPRQVPGLQAVALSAWNHTCAITMEGPLVCMGPNGRGQLGTSDLDPRTEPTPVVAPEGVTGWRGVSTGAEHTCAFDQRGNLYCWGSNASRALGVGGGGDRPVPTRVCFD